MNDDKNKYTVAIEKRDENGDVLGSNIEFTTTDRNAAIERAKELRNQYGTVVIETWDAEAENLLETTFENQY